MTEQRFEFGLIGVVDEAVAVDVVEPVGGAVEERQGELVFVAGIHHAISVEVSEKPIEVQELVDRAVAVEVGRRVRTDCGRLVGRSRNSCLISQ